ncbi:VWA domain-containing protein [uncultured Dysosmobacter sp.]|uniref:VWA domain-containing protein n=1 Tax=uncultured Dysosmobacter sp. TaxID=2591384 RepID=UPI00345D2C46
MPNGDAMFAAFFYLLRRRGLDVSLSQWITLLEGLEMGLHHSSLTGFYHLCRAIVVKSEVEYDRFDQVFLEFFKDVPFKGDLPEELLDWLDHPSEDLRRTIEMLRSQGMPDETLEELLKMLEERLQEQTEEHNGGNYWVGTQGRSPFGNNGWHPGGIRIGGQGRHRTAMTVAGERKYRDFRRDNTLDTRQFQTAFRLLRQLSVQANSAEKVLDVDGTVRDTCDNAGTLQIRYQNPRKNTVKVLLLMDSGGSMDYYSGLCSMLFQAATKSNHFKELHTYYFHNCVYESLYTHPGLRWDSAVPTEWVLQNFDSSYKVIIVGDAAMSPYELWERQYQWGRGTYGDSGMNWLLLLKKQYPYLIWLNPEPLPAGMGFWSRTHLELAKVFPMYDLTAEGLEAGIKRLMVRR